MTDIPWSMTDLAFNFVYSDLFWKPHVISSGNDVLTRTRQLTKKTCLKGGCLRFVWVWRPTTPTLPLTKWRLYWNASANLLKQAGPPKDLPKFLYHWVHKGCTFPSGYPCSPGEKQVGNLDEFFEKKNLETGGCCWYASFWVCDCPQPKEKKQIPKHSLIQVPEVRYFSP